MSSIRIAGLCVMGWVLTASGAVAATPDMLGFMPTEVVQAEQRRMDRAAVTDGGTGADLKLTARRSGGLQASLTWMDLDVAKVVQANGDFHARIAARQDVLVIIRTGGRLRVTRNGQTAVLQLDRADEEGLDLVQTVLAGSHAARMFRGIHRELAAEARDSAPGVTIGHLEALLAILQGDPGALDRRAPAAREAGVRLSRTACCAQATCYSEYEGEAVRAWDDYSQCIYDVRWYPGMQEVCAFTWLLRTESAWFRFIGCSSIPIKVE